MLVVVVTGPPASGKTTIAEPLAAEFRLPLITKDGIKEVLFETLGVGDLGHSRALGGAAFELVWHVLEIGLAAGVSSIVEGNFSTPSQLLRLRGGYAFDIVQIHCHAPERVLHDRYRSRDRHAGHFDDVRHPDFDAARYLLPLDGSTVSIDTASPDAYELARAALSKRAP
jgi:predicted kinase